MSHRQQQHRVAIMLAQHDSASPELAECPQAYGRGQPQPPQGCTTVYPPPLQCPQACPGGPGLQPPWPLPYILNLYSKQLYFRMSVLQLKDINNVDQQIYHWSSNTAFWPKNASRIYLAYLGLSAGTMWPAPTTDQKVMPSISQIMPPSVLPSADQGLQLLFTLAPKSLRNCLSQKRVPWMGTMASKSPEKQCILRPYLTKGRISQQVALDSMVQLITSEQGVHFRVSLDSRCRAALFSSLLKRLLGPTMSEHRRECLKF